MSKCRRSNPVSYKVTEKTTVADIRRIFTSIRKRLRAAFIFQRKEFICTNNIRDAAHELKRWDEFPASYDRGINHLEKSCVYTDVIKNKTVCISQALALLREYEASAYHTPRSRKYIASLKRDLKGRHLSETRTEWLRSMLRRLQYAYPYVTSKNMHRLTKALSRLVTGMDPDELLRSKAKIYPADLLEFGISAAEIAGPWYPKGGTIQSPMDWIRQEGTKYKSLEQHQIWIRSPDVRFWVHHHGLDDSDNQLVQIVENFYIQNRRAPSVQQLHGLNQALERERTEKSIEENVETIRSWLRASKNWRGRHKVAVPPLMGAWYIVEPRDAEDLCRRAQKDGLCVVDAICSIYDAADEFDTVDIDEEEEDTIMDDPLFLASTKEGVCTLLFSTDPRCRTIVGLDEHGICTSEHHCAGRDNKIDKAAWEYFKRH